MTTQTETATESAREYWERMVERFTRNVNTCDKSDLVDLLVSGKADCIVDAVKMHYCKGAK